MKKVLKYFMLALLIVPCALVFTACGSKMSSSDAAKYAFDSYKIFTKNEAYETYQNVKIHGKSVVKNTTEVEVTYKETAKGEDKTASFPTTTEITNEYTFERSGKGENTAIKVEVSSTTVTTSKTVKEDKTLGENTVVTSKSTATYYIGKVGTGAEAKFVKLSETLTTTKTVVDGTEKNAPAEAPKATKTIEEIGLVSEKADDYKTFVEEKVEKVNSFYDFAYTLISGIQIDGIVGEIKVVKDGKKVTASFDMGNVFSSGTIAGGKYDVVFNNQKLSSIVSNQSFESVAGVFGSNSANVEVTYSASVTMPATTDFTKGTVDYTLFNRVVSISGLENM